ncbi:MAG: hypothetical protein KDJ22_03980 [Candidatus Competibacteraceae bacterium]|nr:hypothetical protein [Candidatus Competibacteraceae bacterium]MCP5125865.1 hypothetical protein [Gammaproteobacteria bacterium]HRX70525.1 hypothetical protein [Candidatus Competibacteraceae bacterium]
MATIAEAPRQTLINANICADISMKRIHFVSIVFNPSQSFAAVIDDLSTGFDRPLSAHHVEVREHTFAYQLPPKKPIWPIGDRILNLGKIDAIY